MRTRAALFSSLACMVAGFGLQAAAQATDSQPPSASCPQPFKVTFDVSWRGMGAGTSTLQLVRKGTNEYTYTSSNVARGIFRLADERFHHRGRHGASDSLRRGRWLG
jgi:hypothetical protein